MRILRFILEVLPRLLEAVERLCIRIASKGFHKPGFYLSLLFVGAAGVRLWRRPIVRWWKRIPVRVFAYVLMLLGVRFLLKGCWIFLLLVLPGRLFGRVFRVLGFDESREPPELPRTLSFRFGRLDRAALVFIGIILVIFFINRDQLTPREDSDHNYHMAVARQIFDQKRIPRFDDWEYAPAGRPHLYPPALHCAIALFAGRVEKITQGFQTLQVITYPLALLLTWWFIRWLFGPRMGLMGAFIFSMDMMAGFTMVAVLPSAVVTALMPLILMCFLTRRKKATVVLLTLSLYTHTGIPVLLIFGLFLFSVRHGGYYPFFKKVLTWSAVLYLPWILRMLPQLDWLGMPSTRIAGAAGMTPQALIAGAVLGFLSLQAVSLVFLPLQLWGLVRFKHPAAGFLKHLLVGFLPLLILYGGRFWMHTAPFWAVFAASVLVRFLPERATVRRIVILTLCTMIPLPMLAVGHRHGRFRVVPSVGGSTFALAYLISPATDDGDFERLAGFIERHTGPREIVHVDPKKNYLGDRIVAATGRRVDVGGWASEVRSPRMDERVKRYREIDTDCLFIHEHAGVPDELGCDRIEKIGRFSVGIRGKTKPLDEQSHPSETPDEP